MNFAPGGDTYFTCVVNSSVHVAMCVRSYLALKSLMEAHWAVCMLADQDSHGVLVCMFTNQSCVPAGPPDSIMTDCMCK